MPTPSGDFSFFPNWGIESRILLSYKPPSPSHTHTTPETWTIFSHLVPFLKQYELARSKGDGVLTCMI